MMHRNPCRSDAQTKARWLGAASIVIALSAVASEASAQICAPRPVPVPGLSGAPIWSGTTGTVRQELDDPRWAAAALTSFPNDATETEAAYRVLVDGNELSISWQALAGGDPNGIDAVYLGIGNSGGTNAWVIQLRPPASGVGVIGVTELTFLHKSGSTGSFEFSASAAEHSFLKVPFAWRKNHTTPAADLAVGADWAINAKIDLADPNLGLSSTGHFRVYLATGISYGGTTTTDYKMPPVDCSVSSSGCVSWPLGPSTLVSPVPVDTSTWADAWGAGTAGTPGAAQNECGGGVAIHPLDIETNNTPVNQLNRQPSVNGGTNTFRATIHNIPAPVTAAAVVLARFSIADWGSVIADPMAPWDPIPGSQGYVPPATDGGTATWNPIDSTTARIDFTCAVQTGDTFCPKLVGDPHQCIMVELKKAPGQGYTFTRAVASRNMNFGPASIIDQPSVISTRHRDGTVEKGDVYIYLQKKNLPPAGKEPIWQDGKLMQVARQYAKSPPALARLPRGANDKKKLMAAMAEMPAPAYKTIEDRLKLPVLSAEQALAETWPTYEVHAFLDTGKVRKIGGKDIKILKPMVPYGIYVDHRGKLYGYDVKLSGMAGTTLETISENFYRIKMNARGLAKLSNRIEAVENATPGSSTTPPHEVTEAECRNRFPCKGCGCTLPGRSIGTGQLGILGLMALAVGLGRRHRRPRAAT